MKRGFVNAVIWESVFQRYSVLAKTVSFLGITGTLQVEWSGSSRRRKALGAEDRTQTECRIEPRFSLRAISLHYEERFETEVTLKLLLR
jgi:hypothetical protein